MSNVEPSLAQRAQPPTVLTLPSSDFGLQWRPLRATDAQRLHELFGRIEAADNPPYRTTLEEAQAEKYDLVVQDWVYINPKHDITDKVINGLNNSR